MKYQSPIVFVSTFSVGLYLDFASKRYAETAFTQDPVRVLGDLLVLRYQSNSGIAFSAPVTGLPLKVLTLALIAYVVYYYLREEKYRGKAIIDAAYSAFLAGAVGNGIDRIWMGKVTDFIDLKYFANFNVADIIISISAAVIVAFHIFHERSRTRK